MQNPSNALDRFLSSARGRATLVLALVSVVAVSVGHLVADPSEMVRSLQLGFAALAFVSAFRLAQIEVTPAELPATPKR